MVDLGTHRKLQDPGGRLRGPGDEPLRAWMPRPIGAARGGVRGANADEVDILEADVRPKLASDRQRGEIRRVGEQASIDEAPARGADPVGWKVAGRGRAREDHVAQRDIKVVGVRGREDDRLAFGLVNGRKSNMAGQITKARVRASQGNIDSRLERPLIELRRDGPA